jgi:hypothetical protein
VVANWVIKTVDNDVASIVWVEVVLAVTVLVCWIITSSVSVPAKLVSNQFE